MKKILWNSVAPWIGTGYGQQSALFLPRIRDLGYDVAIAQYVGLDGTISSWQGMTVYPADLTKFNKLRLRSYAEHFADGDPLTDVLVLTLQDVWPWMDPKIGGIVAQYKGLRMASWCPVDHDPIPPMVAWALEEFKSRPIAMSRFGEDALRKAGFDPFYVPHGVDTQVMQPYDNREEIREMFGIPTDAFVVGMVANNQGQEISRKAFPQVFQCISMFQERHPDTFLYLHTDVSGQNLGLNLLPIAESFGINPKMFGYVNQDRYWNGEITQRQLSGAYAMMDVLLNPSLGEGFGVPIIEAQACGTPVIVNDWTAMPELVGAGWLVDGDPFYDSGAGSFWKVPAISSILQALELAYENRGNEKLREEARAFSLQYDVETITEEHWKPTLEALDKPVEVAPLNRAMRRKKAKVAA